MKASFWKALDALGASGSALFNWRHHLGGDWDECARFLKPTGETAFCVIDPRKPRYMLTVSPQGEEDFVGYYEDDTSIPPVPFSARDVAEFGPHWKTIAEALVVAVGFDYDTWESEGHLRRIGSLQDSFGHVRAVLLFMPPGSLGDYHYLFRSLSARFDCTVLVPSGRWITAEIAALGKRNGLTFVNLADRLARTEADAESRIPLPAAVGHRSGGGQTVRVLIQGGNGLTWDQVRVEVGASRRIMLRAPGQDREYDFPPNIRVTEDHALGILMHLAAKGEWRNPPLGAPDYYRVSKSFLRLRKLLKGLVSLPGEPFRKHRGAFVPVFQVGLNRGLLPENQRERRS
jgi:hypothetical protein